MPIGNPSSNYTYSAVQRQTGRYYGVGALGAMVSAVVTDRVYYSPLYVSESRSYAALCVNVTTGGAGNVRAGIYTMTTAGTPGTLISTAGTASVAAAGVKEIAFAQVIPAGWYFMAVHSDAAAAFMTYHQGGGLGSPGGQSDNYGETTLGTYQVACYQSSAYAGGLPATASGLTFDTAANTVGCWLKA